jgi:hypothetical protein
MKVQKKITSTQPTIGIDKTLWDEWAVQDNKILRQAAQKVYRSQARREELQEKMSDPFHSNDNEYFMGNDYY